MESIALKAAMVLPALLLQKPHKQSKSCEHIKCLECHLHLWQEGDIDALLKEGSVIQLHLRCSRPSSSADSSRIFARLEFQGKVRAAMRFLMDRSHGSFLPLSASVFDEIIKKYPIAPTPMSLVSPSVTPLRSCHPVIFDGNLICHTALCTKGSAGPSGMDALGWRQLVLLFKLPHQTFVLKVYIHILC